MMISNVLNYKGWASKGILSVIDQAIYSGSNFVLTLFLARIMSPEQYGSYAIVFSFFIFFSGFNNALILEPLSVIGPIKGCDEISKYFLSSKYINFILSMVLGIGLAITGYFYSLFGAENSNNQVSLITFFSSALTVPFTFELWYWRRVCYIKQKPIFSLYGNVLYSVTVFLLTILFWKIGILNATFIFVIIGLSALIVCAFYFFFYREINEKRREISRTFIRNVINEHWEYGKWVVGSAFVYWLSTGIYLPILGKIASIDDVGAYKAIQNLIMPFQQTITGLSLLILPWLSRIMQTKNSKRIYVVIISIICSVLSLFYTALIILFGPQIIDFVFNQPFINQYFWLIPFFCGVIVVTSIGQGPMMGLKALRKPNIVFWSQVGGAIFSISIGVFLVVKYKVMGSAMASLITYSIMTIIQIIFIQKFNRN